MSTKANPAAIGLFVIGAFAITVGTIVFLGSGKLFAPKDKFILYFEDSVHGLDEGALVKFKGVQVGRVEQILIHFNQPKRSVHIPVVIEVDRKKILESLGDGSGHWDQELFEQQLRHGLRGRLELQSIITGVLIVALDYFEDVDAPRFVQEKPIYREIPTRASAFSDLGRDISQTLESLSHIDFQKLFGEAQSLLENANRRLNEMRIGELSDAFRGMAQSIEARVSSDLVTDVLDQGRKFLASGDQTFNNLDKQIEPLSESIQSTAQRLKQSLEQLDSTLGLYSSLVAPENARNIPAPDMLNEITATAQALREFLAYLERHPNALLTGRAEPQRP